MRTITSIKVGNWRRRFAQEPDEGVLVKELNDSPIAKWEEYLQLIVRVLGLQFGAEVELAGPKLENEFGTSANFEIVGTLRFKSERPLAVVKKYGKNPLRFTATISDGKLVEPIIISI